MPRGKRGRSDPSREPGRQDGQADLGDLDWNQDGGLQQEGERQREVRPVQTDPLVDDVGFQGPNLADAEVRAAVGFMTGAFKVPALDPDAPDVWVENVRDALYTSGMSAVYRAADCRIKAEVPVRLRNETDMIEPWKLAFAWTAVRRSLNGVPSIHQRTGRCKFADIEGCQVCPRCVSKTLPRRRNSA